jgi:hypothetical protein
MKTSNRGIPILSLDEKLKALRYCLNLPDPREDAMGHLFDLIAHIAPDYKFIDLKGVAAIASHYGAHPTPIEED